VIAVLRLRCTGPPGTVRSGNNVETWAAITLIVTRIRPNARCRKSGWPKTKAAAELAFDAFIESYTPKYEKAADCLSKDRDTLLAFYDFPAEHWKHLRTTNPIESTFATVRHRPIRSKGCLFNRTALAMVFKLLEAAQKSWRRLDGHNQLPKLVLSVTFNNGIEVIAKPADRQPITAAA
jgi:putative transposase